jgi:hypothetical protein
MKELESSKIEMQNFFSHHQDVENQALPGNNKTIFIKNQLKLIAINGKKHVGLHYLLHLELSWFYSASSSSFSSLLLPISIIW